MNTLFSAEMNTLLWFDKYILLLYFLSTSFQVPDNTHTHTHTRITFKSLPKELQVGDFIHLTKYMIILELSSFIYFNILLLAFTVSLEQ